MDQRTSGSDIPIGTTRASELNESGRGAAGSVRDRAREMGHQAAERAQAAIGEQKERATSELGAVAFALRDAATRLEGENMMSGRLIRTAAERLDDFSRRLETRDLEGLMWETRNWARRNPAVFMGAAVALGFLASRFLKASEEPRFYGAEGDGWVENHTPWAADEAEYPRNEPRGAGGRDSTTPSGTGFTPGNSGSGDGGTHGRS